MTIRIIEEPEIILTRSEEEHLRNQYQNETRNWYGVNPPPSFETWVRSRKRDGQQTGESKDPRRECPWKCQADNPACLCRSNATTSLL